MSVCILCVKPALKYTKSRVSLHKFPVCPNKRQIWLNRCRLTDEQILPHHKICSLHFKRSCFKPGTMRRKLYRDAEPTIFKKGHAKITNTPLKNLEVKTGKLTKPSQSCILCEKPVPEYPILMKSFHRFPVHPKKRQIWLNHCGLTNEEVLPNHKICSLHFKQSCFKSGAMRSRLSSDAEPTIFKEGHDKITNMPPKNVKGRSKNCNKKGIAVQHHQSRDILKTVNAVKKGISSQMLESSDISPKTVIFDKNRLSPKILPTKAVNEKFTDQISQSRVVSPTESVQNEISSQNRESCDIALTRTVKRRIARQKRKSCNISQTKLSNKVIVDQNNQSRNVSPTKSVLKGIPDQKHESCDIASTKACKERIANQKSKSRDISPTKSVQNEIFCQNCESCDYASNLSFAKEVYERTLILVNNLKKKIAGQDAIIENLKKETALAKSRFENDRLLNNRFPNHDNTKK
ncbi:uncharacterized protein LOC111041446 [Myzus persicae]|uniref:uncharacterized protein LOC111041446 n=1 Tax=Myzus persicae TaxID=13164 RepID=UPI000B938B2F|nr:uncharacterized protein LOC111041446 [Myzus persicae]